MNVLLNGTTLVKGGGLQVAVAFIKQALQCESDINWRYALSVQVVRELDAAGIVITDGKLNAFTESPAKSLEARLKLSELEVNGEFDAVLTLFGPAYVKFQTLHICGVADPWVTHAHLLAFRSLGSFVDVTRTLMLMVYKALWYRKANAWIVEAKNARQGLIKRLRLKPELIYVIPNTCGEGYRKSHVEMRLPEKGAKLRILCLSAYYKHKNLEIIPEVAKHIREMSGELEFEFVITLPQGSEGHNKLLRQAAELGVAEYINNIGPVTVNQGSEIYQGCHIAFLPSLLETFSANYPEAMAMRLPIVTTDLGFAHDVCKDAALYFRPRDAESAAERFIKLIGDPLVWEQLVINGDRVLQSLPTPKQKYFRYVDILQSLHARKMGAAQE